jgi:hypothetical protein
VHLFAYSGKTVSHASDNLFSRVANVASAMWKRVSELFHEAVCPLRALNIVQNLAVQVGTFLEEKCVT